MRIDRVRRPRVHWLVVVGLAMHGGLATFTRADGPTLYKRGDGPHAIKVVANLVLHDSKQDKDLHIRVTYPGTSDGKPLPLIIWSHGATGSKDGYQPLARYWASYGYAVIQPTHADSRKLNDYRGMPSQREVGRHYRSRPADVRCIIDSLHIIERRVPGLPGVDRRRIAVGGHSYGALTGLMLADARVRQRGSLQLESFADQRVRCFVLVSPQGPSGLFSDRSYQTITRPTLMVTGDNDGSPYRDQQGAWRRKAYDLAPAGNKFLLWIDQAHHGFGGISGSVRYRGAGPENDLHVDLVRTTALAFLDTYLGVDAQARAYLNGDAITAASDQAAHVERK